MIRSLAMLATAALATPPPVSTQGTFDVPQDKGEQQVIVQSRVFDPGSESGWHVHPGVEMAWVISGEMEIATAGGVRHLLPGDSFIMPRGTPHNGLNRGKEPARIAITLVVDKGVAPRQSVPAP